MDNSITVQGYIFLTALYGGLLIGFAYDIYRAIRYFLKPKKAATILGDIIFWILISLMTFYILIKSSWGEIRGYILFGFILGAILYLKVLAKIIYPVLKTLFDCVGKAFKKFIDFIFFPFKKLIKISLPHVKKTKKILEIPKEMAKETRKYKKIISTKK